MNYKFELHYLKQSSRGVLYNRCSQNSRETPVPEYLALAFSCEFCENSKNTLFYRTPLVAASESICILKHVQNCLKIPKGEFMFIGIT